jgi:uncharacterized DUF497 family protein
VIYEWDPGKARLNARKHRVSLEEAATVFLDPFALTFDDPDHSLDERRFITLGASGHGRVLFVAHSQTGEDQTRIISARKATRRERHGYQEAHEPNRG